MLLSPVAPYVAYLPTIPLQLLVALLRLFSSIPGSFFHLAKPHYVTIGLYYLSFVTLYLFRKRLFKHGMILLMIALFVIFLSLHIWHGYFEEPAVHFLDAQSSNIIVVLSKKQTIVINTGYSSQTEWILKPFLTSHGIQVIDALIITSAYKRDWAGLGALVRNFTIKEIIMPHVEPLEEIKDHMIPITHVRTGDLLLRGDFRIRVTSAPDRYDIQPFSKTATCFDLHYNDRSNFVFIHGKTDFEEIEGTLPDTAFIAYISTHTAHGEIAAQLEPAYLIINTLDRDKEAGIKSVCKNDLIRCLNPALSGYVRVFLNRSSRDSFAAKL